VAYGEDVVPSGPVYDGMKIEGGQIRIRFRHVGQGLEARGEKLLGFEIAGRDHRFAWADAHIEGNTVVVSGTTVPVPLAVRYAWGDNPACNLSNKDGLAASPFRTDDWPGTTKPIP
jgi:sialate O-acetylesterase